MNKKHISLGLGALSTVALAIPVFADDTATATDTINSALETALQGVSNDALGVIATVVPYALAVVGAILVVKLGIKAFKSIAGR